MTVWRELYWDDMHCEVTCGRVDKYDDKINMTISWR